MAWNPQSSPRPSVPPVTPSSSWPLGEFFSLSTRQVVERDPSFCSSVSAPAPHTLSEGWPVSAFTALVAGSSGHLWRARTERGLLYVGVGSLRGSLRACPPSLRAWPWPCVPGTHFSSQCGFQDIWEFPGHGRTAGDRCRDSTSFILESLSLLMQPLGSHIIRLQLTLSCRSELPYTSPVPTMLVFP